MNGAPLGQRFRRSSAYVAQEDVFVPTLSAWETLKFHASMRTARGTPKAEIKQRMINVLTVMGLWRVRNTQASTHLSVHSKCIATAWLNASAVITMEAARLPASIALFCRDSSRPCSPELLPHASAYCQCLLVPRRVPSFDMETLVQHEERS